MSFEAPHLVFRRSRGGRGPQKRVEQLRRELPDYVAGLEAEDAPAWEREQARLTGAQSEDNRRSARQLARLFQLGRCGLGAAGALNPDPRPFS